MNNSRRVNSDLGIRVLSREKVVLCANGSEESLRKLSCSEYSRHAHLGWLLLAGSLQLQLSLAKDPCKRDYSAKERCNFKIQVSLEKETILQKTRVILRSPLIQATPYPRQ